ncbi:AAA family ATPase [bacterium]|nr:AAA family ATPase [bacterium]
MYLDFFKLNEKPFNVTPDPHFLYMSQSHQEAFANLLYGIRERKGFTVLTGEVGTGKTTLLHNLLSTLEDEIQTVYIFHTGLDFDEMLLMVHRELSIEVQEETRGGMIQSLNHYLIDQLRRDQNVALIIDEAQNLSSEFLENLRLLSNLETAKEKLLQIVLVGQPELEAKLGLTELRQLDSRISVKGRIHPLDSQESESYLLHRLSLAGAATSNIFDRDALKLVCKNGRGIPRRLNMLADNSMLIAYAEGDRVVKQKHVRECLKDFEKMYTATPEGQDEGRRKRSSTLPWFMFTALLALTLVYVSYEFGKRQVIERIAPDNLPATSLAEDMVQVNTMPPESNNTLEESVDVVPTQLPLEYAAVSPDLDTLPRVADEAMPKTWPAALSLSQIRQAVGRAPRIAYRIRHGDQFNRLTQRLSGRRDPLFLAAVHEMNPHIQDFDHIRPGWILFFPDPEASHE